MDSLNEEIDSILNNSLLEIDISDISGDDPEAKQQKAAADKLRGLDKAVAKELTGLFRLYAIEHVLGSPAAPRVLRGQQLYPDVTFNVPKLETVQQALKKFLNYEESPSDIYAIDTSVATSRSTEIVDYTRWANGKRASAAKFVRGEAPLEIDGKEYNLNFKDSVAPSWRTMQDVLLNYIKRATPVVARRLNRALPTPASPMTGALKEALELPSEISKEDSNLYVKITSFLQDKGTEVDRVVLAMQKKHFENIDGFLEKYKNQNDQKTRDYGYTGPRYGGISKTIWDNFTTKYLAELDKIVNKANSDYDRQIFSARDVTARARRTFGSPGPILPENLVKEDKLTTITLDFNKLKKQKLDESFLAMFGGWVEQILGSMFGGRSLPLAVKGSQRDVQSFAKALGGEKSYLEAVKRYGLDHPTTYKNRSKLDNAIKGFERETGLKWPFK